ncbi:ATP-binding protein [Niveispirillum sp. BGYR6]|uniref:sensor histidine kinase n=1 Tax=Niveispirillum sp. BGYR6 TaxID=2971249 RepID=UPI0022B97A47|nr:ATP-binding protein [Niveispirillum sp. BGYR6]MDG5493439.1 ATP-binding protein [Niveispirillum sp. BGYR6]
MPNAQPDVMAVMADSRSGNSASGWGRRRLLPSLRALVPTLVAIILMAGLYSRGGQTVLDLSNDNAQILHNMEASVRLADIGNRMQGLSARFNWIMVLKAAEREGIDVRMELDKAIAALDAVIADMEAYRRAGATTEQIPAINDMLNELSDYRSAVTWVGSMVDLDYPSAVAYLESFGQVFDRVQGQLGQMVSAHGDQARQLAAAAARRADLSIQTFLYFAIAMSAGVALLSWLTGRYQQRLRVDTELLQEQVELRTADLQRANAELAASATTLSRLGHVGRELTATLDLGQVYAALAQSASDLLPTETFGIALLNEAGDHIAYEMFNLDGKPYPDLPIYPLDHPTSLTVRALSFGGDLMVLDQAAAASAPSMQESGDSRMASLIFCPLAISDHILGVLTVQTRQPNAYGPREQDILRTLAANAAIAIANAQAYRQLGTTLTELRAAHTRLVQQEKLASLGGLVAGVAHEINTPLGVALTGASFIEGQCQELKVRLDKRELKRSDLDEFIKIADEGMHVVLTNLTRAADLVQSFKLVAADQHSEEAQLIDLGRYLRDMVRSLEPLLRRSRVAMKLDLADGVMLRVAPGPVAQLATNLVQNAVIHAFAGVAEPTISIHLPAPSDANLPVRFMISDNGVGMVPEVAAKAFDPFFTTRRGSGGTGLGLHIVHNLAQAALGGDVELKTAPGEGCLFTITLPRQPPQRMAAAG